MRNHVFLVPIGIPGMGKSTLARKLPLKRPDLKFNRVCYDSILTDKIDMYRATQTTQKSFHEILDIVRADADQAYLDQLSSKAFTGVTYLDRCNTPDIWQDLRRNSE